MIPFSSELLDTVPATKNAVMVSEPTDTIDFIRMNTCLLPLLHFNKQN